MPNLYPHFDEGTFEAYDPPYSNPPAPPIGGSSVGKTNEKAHEGVYSLAIFYGANGAPNGGAVVPGGDIAVSFALRQATYYPVPLIPGERYKMSLFVATNSIEPGLIGNDELKIYLGPQYSDVNGEVLHEDADNIYIKMENGDLLKITTVGKIKGKAEFTEISYEWTEPSTPLTISWHLWGRPMADTPLHPLATPGAAIYNSGKFFVDGASLLLASEAVDENTLIGKLYHRRNIFILSVAGNQVEINEPIGWDKLLIQIKMDMELFGFKFEFIDKDIELSFDDAAGRSLLKQNYINNGADADAVIAFGQILDNEEIEIYFEMQLSFDSYTEDECVVKMTASRLSFNDLFRSRFNVRTSLGSTETVSGQAALPAVKSDIWLLPYQVEYKSQQRFNDFFTEEPVALTQVPKPGSGTPSDSYFSVPPYKSAGGNVPGLQEPYEPDGLLFNQGALLSGRQRRITFYLKAAYFVTMTANQGGATVAADIIVYKKKVGEDANIVQDSALGYDPTGVNPPLIYDVLYRETVNLGNLAVVDKPVLFSNGAGGTGFVLKSNENVFIKFVIYQKALSGNDLPFAGTVSARYRLPEFWELRWEENSVSYPVGVEGYRLFEAIDKQIELITDKPNILRSDLLGRIDLGYLANGCASHFVTFSGRMLRGIDADANLSAKEWTNSLHSLYCIGVNVERDATDGSETLRVEDLKYFFKNVQLRFFTKIAEYEKECAADLIFNELGFGFAKFPRDGQDDSLHEWMTQNDFTTPIKKVKNKLDRLCDFILSNYYIKYTVDQRFQETQQETFETDKDNFLLGVKDDSDDLTGGSGTVFWNGIPMNIDTATNTITCDVSDVPFLKNETFTLATPGSPNNGVWTVLDMDIQRYPEPLNFDQTVLYILEPLIADEIIASASVVMNKSYITPRQDEDFTNVQNIPQKQFAHNLEHTIKSILLRWAKYFKTGLHEKGGMERIKLSESQGSTTPILSFSSAYTCKPPQGNSPISGLPFNLPVSESADRTLEKLDKALMKSNYIRFEVAMSWVDLNDMRKAFEGRHPDGKDYGYISLINPEGEIENGRLFELKFDPIKQIAKITLIENG